MADIALVSSAQTGDIDSMFTGQPTTDQPTVETLVELAYSDSDWRPAIVVEVDVDPGWFYVREILGQIDQPGGLSDIYEIAMAAENTDWRRV